MSNTPPGGMAEALSDGQKAALLQLLTDEDASVYQTVRGKILSHGQVAWLRPHLLSDDAVLRRRIRELVEHLDRQMADQRFMAFCLHQGEDYHWNENSQPANDKRAGGRFADEARLEEGAWLLAQTRYPDINVTAYQALLDNFAGELRERIDPAGPPDKILGGINDYLFSHLGFNGNKKRYFAPENSYLNRVIDTRSGNPIGLCTIYILIARRLRLPVTGIGMPGHFLCRYQSPLGEVYIDAFNQGLLLTKKDCMKQLVDNGHGVQEGYLSSVSPRRIILRMCSNLHQIYVHLGQTDESARMQRYIVALAK